jgi:hypothetical protein
MSQKNVPAFFTSPEFDKFMRKSFAAHRANEAETPEIHLFKKHLELESELNTKTLLYLDINHWIHLRDVVLKKSQERPGYRDILELLKILSKQQRICCPISFVLFLELMKQSDPNTRLPTAKLMDLFGGGVCFQFPFELDRLELKEQLLRNLFREKAPQLNKWFWTKAGFLGGELLPSHPAFGEENKVIQKAWIDFMWMISLEFFLSLRETFNFDISYWQKYADAANADAVFYRTSTLPFEEVLQREKALLGRRLLMEELPKIGQEIWDLFPQFRDVTKLKQPVPEDYSPHNSPSLQVLAAIIAADMLSKKNFTANDILDYRHSALAIPYCDALFCDNPMATRLRNNPIQFEKVYETKILSRPEEIINYLKSLVC